MRPDLSHRINDVFAPFLKLCGWTAITIGAADAISDKKLLLDTIFSQQTFEGLKSLSVLLTAASGFALNKSNDYYKECREKLNLAINGDLETALKNALSRAIDTVRDDYNAEGSQTASTQIFFDKLKEELNATIVDDHLIESYAADRSYFLYKYVQGQQFSDLEASEDLVEYLARVFPKVVTHAFLKELKGNPKAEIAYRTVLTEMSVRQGHLSNETLQVIQADLLRLADSSETVQEQMHRIYHLLQLIQQNLTKQNIDLSARFRQLETLLQDTSQPSLTNYALDYKQADDRFHYHYKTGYTTFIGRQTELSLVETFVLPNADTPFRWWLLTGPGGMGKSRLAQEICLRFNPYETWYAGFISVKQLRNFSWRTWVPKHHTLIVVDYISTREKEVEEMLTALYERREAFNRLSVRVLLLERDTSGLWWDILQKSLGASTSQYAEPLGLAPFADDDRWRIIEEVYCKVTDDYKQLGKPLPAPLPSQSETLNTLTELDGQKRPLFAFFVGMALAAGRSIRDWNINRLLEHILDEHERKRWRENTDATVLKKHERLLALATITRGLTSSHWRILQKVKSPVLPDSIDADLYHRMTGVINLLTEKIYLPLEPDILGEFLVKRVFEEILNDDNYKPELVQELVWLAWQFNPIETWGFAERLLVDFPNARFVASFWAPFPSGFWNGQSSDEALIIAVCWSKFQVNLTNWLAYDNINDLINKYNQIEQLRTLPGFEHNFELLFEQAQAAYNIINQLNGNKQLLNKAEIYYSNIEQLRQECLQNPRAVTLFFQDGIKPLRIKLGRKNNIKLAILQAQAAMNLTNFFGNHQDTLHKAEEYFEKIEELCQQFNLSEVVELAIQLAQAAYCLATDFAHREIDEQSYKLVSQKVMLYYDKIEQLRARPYLNDIVELAIEQARAATHVINILGAHKQLLEQAEYYLQKTWVLSNAFKTVEIIRKATRATRLLFEHYINHINTGTINHNHASDRLNHLFNIINNINELAKERDEPFIQIEYSITCFILLTKTKTNGVYPSEQILSWQQTMRTSLLNFYSYQEYDWQEYYKPRFVQYFQQITNSKIV